MLSGGPDSALALKEALATNEPVVAFHASIINEPRWPYELAACRQLHTALFGLRPFDFVNAKIENTFNVQDLLMLAPFAASMCNRYLDIGKIWVGEDVQQIDGALDTAFIQMVRSAIFSKRFPNTPLNFAYHPAPGFSRTKSQIRQALGDLWPLTWSCRTPTPSGPCHTCDACHERDSTDA
jgi:7-cyano-7-deazaguanine synthase in queuosine biosynthesis